MKPAIRYIGALVVIWFGLAWHFDAALWSVFEFQLNPRYRNWSGAIVMAMLVFQWGLTLGRSIFQKSGSQWGRWIDWHLRIALILPFAVLAHSVQLGWGMLGVLPLALLASGHFGTLLEGENLTKKYLPFHIILAALTMAMALVHAYSVVMYN
jgi:hypothetical protein